MSFQEINAARRRAADERMEEIESLLGYGFGWAEILRAVDFSAESMEKFLRDRKRPDLSASLAADRAKWAQRRREAVGFSDLRLTST